MRGLIVCCALLGGCGTSSLKRAGEACSASSECASGLLCDLAMKSPTCADKGSLDAPPPATDGKRTDAKPLDAKPLDAGSGSAVGSDAAPD